MDDKLLEELFRKYYRGAVLYCMALCGNEQLAQDIAADAFVKAYLSLPDEVPSFRYWLLRVCKNLWLDHLRRRRHEEPERMMDYIADERTPEQTYLIQECHQTLWKQIQKLPSEDRELVVLHYFSGISFQEIAAMTRKSYPAVRQRMTRLRQKLRQEMEEQGYGR